MSRKNRAPISFAKPQVDIVTPVYGSPHFLVGLRDTLLTIDAGVKFHWWVIDDCGPKSKELDDAYESIDKDTRCTVIKAPKNLGFAGANNTAVKKGVAPVLLLLNSDTRIRKAGWLATMLENTVQPNVGVVGAKLTYFDDVRHANGQPGMVQHAGVVFNLLGQPYHIFANWHPNHPKVMLWREELNAVTGACFMTPRKLYERIGGLDIDYTTGNFEDVQYCLQARALRQKVVYDPAVHLDHYAGGSGNSATARFNESLFRVKCNHLLPHDDYLYW